MKTAADTMQTRCGICGGEILTDVSFGECPRCLLDLGTSHKLGDCGGMLEEVQNLEEERWSESGSGFDFELLELIGRGGMGVVYRARQISLDRIVAVKMVRMGGMASPATLARFRLEAETAAKLDHANIVPIYEVGEREANPYLVMRYMGGGSLGERMGEFALVGPAKGRPGEWSAERAQRRIVQLMREVARAVDYAHERGVLHRDLKPSNILLDEEGRAHVTDFGIAKVMDEESGITQTAEILGTPAYMAPEQAAGGAVSRGTDVYSLGTILFELLTGRAPFRGDRPMETMRQVMEEEAAHPRQLNPAVSEDLATICLKCLDKEPARRYGSARELEKDLERWERHEPILARRAGAALRLRRWMARNPAVTTFIIALVIGMGLTLGLLATANEEKQRKSVALAILRTEAARQLQQIWDSESPYFGIKSETLSAMAGMEPEQLRAGEKRYTIGLVAEGNPLDRLLRAARFLGEMEEKMSALGGERARLDVKMYKEQGGGVEELLAGRVDFMQMNGREYLRAKEKDPEVQALLSFQEGVGDAAVIFAREGTGINLLGDLRGRSFLMSRSDSTLSFWTQVALAEAGVKGIELRKYRYLETEWEWVGERKVAGAAVLGNPFSDMTPVEAVLSGIYDAAVVREGRFREVAGRYPLVELHRFRDSVPVLVARGKLPAGLKEVFQKGAMELKKSAAAESFQMSARPLKMAEEGEFGGMREKLWAEDLFRGSGENPLREGEAR